MTEPERDLWSQWLLDKRFGGDADKMRATMAYLYPVRDRVLKDSNLNEKGTLLDVGCGDGLVGFGALEKFASTKVIFADISQDLVDRTRAIATQMGLLNRCQFACIAAEDLSAVDDQSVEAVTTRSILIY